MCGKPLYQIIQPALGQRLLFAGNGRDGYTCISFRPFSHSVLLTRILPCKAKRQYLLTLVTIKQMLHFDFVEQVSRYTMLEAIQGMLSIPTD